MIDSIWSRISAKAIFCGPPQICYSSSARSAWSAGGSSDSCAMTMRAAWRRSADRADASCILSKKSAAAGTMGAFSRGARRSRGCVTSDQNSDRDDEQGHKQRGTRHQHQANQSSSSWSSISTSRRRASSASSSCSGFGSSSWCSGRKALMTALRRFSCLSSMSRLSPNGVPTSVPYGREYCTPPVLLGNLC